MTSFVAVEEVDHLFLLVFEEGLSSEPKYRSNFFKNIFLSLFCLLCYRFPVRISLLFYIFYVLLVYIHVKVNISWTFWFNFHSKTYNRRKLWNLTVNSQNRIKIIIIITKEKSLLTYDQLTFHYHRLKFWWNKNIKNILKY